MDFYCHAHINNYLLYQLVVKPKKSYIVLEAFMDLFWESGLYFRIKMSSMLMMKVSQIDFCKESGKIKV